MTPGDLLQVLIFIFCIVAGSIVLPISLYAKSIQSSNGPLQVLPVPAIVFVDER